MIAKKVGIRRRKTKAKSIYQCIIFGSKDAGKPQVYNIIKQQTEQPSTWDVYKGGQSLIFLWNSEYGSQISTKDVSTKKGTLSRKIAYTCKMKRNQSNKYWN